MTYEKIPANLVKEMQLSAGFLTTTFDPMSASSAVPFAATSGGVNFAATPTYFNWGEGIDHLPRVKELEDVDTYEVKMSGTFKSINADTAKKLLGAADVASETVTPRSHLKDEDFTDLWFVGDYGAGGTIAIHMFNTLSTGGFQMQTTDKQSGSFAFEFSGHYSMTDIEQVPCEVYIKSAAA